LAAASPDATGARAPSERACALMKKKKKPQRTGCSFRDLARGADTIAETTWLEDQLPPRKVHVGSDCAGLLTEGSLSRSNSVFL
jgi:hypothetical protein